MGRFAFSLLIIFSSSIALAGPMDQAMRIHQRLTGVMPTPEVLNQMTALVANGQSREAAQIALQNRNFYDVTIKNWASTWSNVKQTSIVNLNDTTATIIGAIKDDLPFNQIVNGDLLYIGDPAVVNVAYSKVPQEANSHFTAVVNTGRPLSEVLVRRTQSAETGIADVAGIITTQGWSDAYFKDGTNRRVFMGAMRHFWCSEMDQIHDTSIPSVRIRRDVDRAPSNSAALFQTKCLGCHGTMDAAAGSLAFFDYTDETGLTHTPGRVAEKMNRNNQTYPDGFVTANDSWIFLGNYSATKSFDKYGWRSATSGNGLNSFATGLAQSRGFSDCMAKKVFQKVCLRDADVSEAGLIKQLADGFESNGQYNLKNLFVETAVRCVQ